MSTDGRAGRRKRDRDTTTPNVIPFGSASIETASVPALAARYVGVALSCYVLQGWVRLLWSGKETIENKDWVGFYRAGWLWLHGSISAIYTDPASAQQPFLNPPWFIWFCVPVGGWRSPWPPYLICAGLAVLGGLAATLMLKRLTGASLERAVTAGAVLFGSAAWLGCAQTGQLSGLLLLLVSGVLVALCAGRPVLAGLLLAALAIKPNIALPLLALAAVRGHGRLVLGALVGMVVMAASTLPLGSQLWLDWRAATHQILRQAFDGSLAPWMHQTQLAFWAWLVRPHFELLPVTWTVTAGLAAVVTAASWRRTRRTEALPRLFGQAMLALFVVSPYLFFYDGLLLALPALSWYFQAESFASRRTWWTCGVLLALIFAWQHVQMFSHYVGCPPLVGPLCLLWLLFDVRDLRTGEFARSTG